MFRTLIEETTCDTRARTAIDDNPDSLDSIISNGAIKIFSFITNG
jgi:hypothetical protein